jgi:hypothetical protein
MTAASINMEASELDELKQEVKSLKELVTDLQKQVQQQNEFMKDNGIPTPAERSTAPDFTRTPEWESMERDVAEALDYMKQKRPGIFNPSVSAAVDFVSFYAEEQGLDFVPRDIEILLQSNIDTYAFAYVLANGGAELDTGERTGTFRRPDGGFTLGIEEAAIHTTSLPYGLQVKGGMFFADFTRMGKVHPHERPFVDGPRSIDSIVGGETKAIGWETTWLTPLEQYLRLTFGMVDGIGAEPPNTAVLTLPDGTTRSPYETNGFRSFADMTYYARAATIFELCESANLHLGADAASDFHAQRRIASADMKLDWKPFPAENDRFVWSGEVIWQRQEGALPEGEFIATGNPFTAATPSESAGFYTYAQYRFGKYWEPGLRFDLTEPEGFELRDNDGDGNAFELSTVKDQFVTYTAYLSAYPSENHRLRLQVSYVDARDDPLKGGGNMPGNPSEWQVFLQWTATFGEHIHPFSP